MPADLASNGALSIIIRGGARCPSVSPKGHLRKHPGPTVPDGDYRSMLCAASRCFANHITMHSSNALQLG